MRDDMQAADEVVKAADRVDSRIAFGTSIQARLDHATREQLLELAKHVI
jgi:hypothetical protein